MTAAQVRRKAEKGLRDANPDAAITIEWRKTRRVTYPTGYRGWRAEGTITAPGYGAASLTATCDLDGRSMMTTTWSARQTAALVAPMMAGR